MKLLTYFMTIILGCASFAQASKDATPIEKTKMEAFLSKTGTIIKMQDYNLPTLKLYLTSAENRIRKITRGEDSVLFFQIEKSGQYSSSTASIVQTDLQELMKAFTKLKNNVEGDLKGSANYLENKFVTDDGVALGYYIDKGKARWFMKLQKYGSDNTIYFSDADTIQTMLTTANAKMDELSLKI